MAYPVWPPLLPQNIFLGANMKPEKNVIVTRMGAGMPKRRRRSATKRRVLTETIELSGAELVILRDFHETTLKDGAMPFHRVGQDIDDGDFTKVLFVEPPSWQLKNGAVAHAKRRYDVKVSLEIHA